MAANEIQKMQITMSKLQHAVEALTNAITKNPVGRPRKIGDTSTASQDQNIKIDTKDLRDAAGALKSISVKLDDAYERHENTTLVQLELVKAADALKKLFLNRDAREASREAEYAERNKQRDAEQKQKEAERARDERNRNIFETIGNIGNRMSSGLGSGLVANVGHGLTAGIGRMGMVGAIMGGVTALLKGVVEGLVNTIKSVFNVIKGVFDWVLGHMASLHDLIKLSVMGAKMNGGTFSNANTLAARAIQGADNVTGMGLSNTIMGAYQILADPQKQQILAGAGVYGDYKQMLKDFDSEDGFGALRVTKKIYQNLYYMLKDKPIMSQQAIMQSLGTGMEFRDLEAMFKVQKDGRIKFDEFENVAKSLNNYAKQVGINDLTPRKYALIQEKSNLLSQGIGSTWGEYVLQVLEVLNELGRDLHTRLGSKESFRNSVKDFVDTICNFIKYLGQGGIDRLDSALGYLTNKNGLLADFTWLKNGLLSFADVMLKVADYFRNSFIGDKLGISDIEMLKTDHPEIKNLFDRFSFGEKILDANSFRNVASKMNADEIVKMVQTLFNKGASIEFEQFMKNGEKVKAANVFSNDNKNVVLEQRKDKDGKEIIVVKIDGKIDGYYSGGDATAYGNIFFQAASSLVEGNTGSIAYTQLKRGQLKW